MKTILVFFLDTVEERYKLEERPGEVFDSTDPKAYGLDPNRHVILLTFQHGSYINAWIKGSLVKK